MKIGLACGGTGGHMFPGMATAETLRRRGHEVTLWLSGNDTEKDAAKDWDGRVVTVPSQGFTSGVTLKSLVTLWKIAGARRSCVRIMKKDRPDALLAMGSRTASIRAGGIPAEIRSLEL